MKKILSLVLCLMMLVSGCALAEADAAIEMFEGSWVQFDDGINVYLPNDWVVVEELSEESIASGIYYMAGTPDSASYLTIAWKPLEAALTAEEIHATLVEGGTDAEILTTETTQLVYYIDWENDSILFVMPDPVDPGLYVFSFTPISEDFALTAGMIIGTVHHTPVEEAAE